MFAAGKTAAVSGGAPDDKFNYVTMLLHGDGTNGAQNNTFVDSSTNNLTITRNGNVSQGSFSPYGSGWSNYFNGSSSTPLNFPDNNGFTFDADFTIEAWVFLSSTSAFQVVTSKWDVGGQEWLLAVDANGVAEFHWAPYSEGGPAIESSSGAVTANQWTHLAAVRSGSTITLYVNGTSVGTRTNGTAGTNRTTLVTIGYLQYLGGDKLTGYVSNLRIVKGTAVYTSTFTPSTTPLTAVSNTQLLTCQSNRFVDNSTNNFTASVNGASVQRFNPFGASSAYSTSVIGGSGYFDGTSDSLTYTGGSSLNFGTGDFTIELWAYLANTGTYSPFLRPDDSGAFPEFGYNFSTGQLQFDARSGAIAAVTTTMPTNQWAHIAACRSGTNLRLFINGTQVGSTTTNSTNFGSTTGTIRIGGSSFSGSHNVNGYVSNFRVLKGTALYTTTFTPPTEPLTAITNTTLLLGMTNGAIFDNAMMNDLETVGNVQISTSVKKFGTGSLAFDGSGDYLAGPYNPNVDFGTGDFTVEFWFYFNGSVTAAGFVGSKNTGGMDFSFTSSSLRIGRINTAWDSIFSWSPSANTWYHIAYTRSSGVARAFVNGTQVDANSSNTNNYYPNGGIYVGVAAPPDRYVNGYIDDLRITKGYARYTSNFTAPTAAFSDKGPY